MEIIWFDTLPSTQNYLIEKIKTGELSAPVCVAAKTQTDGRGSRANRWESVEDALLFSFALPLSALPDDLKLESASIYFMYILKESLNKLGSSCWFKWPNDIYLEGDKIGGAITQFIKERECFICGIGLNLLSLGDFSACDVSVDKDNFIYEYLNLFTTPPNWKHILKSFEVEFLKTRDKIPYKISGQHIESATLNSDGSLSIDNKKVFSLR